MKTTAFGIIFFILSSYLIPALANTNIIASNQPTNECGVNKIEVIVGGKSGIEKNNSEQNSKCFISKVIDSEKTKSVQLLKLNKSSSVSTDIKNNITKINLNDPNTIKDRNLILQSELKKSEFLRDELTNKKKNGLIVDELHLNRLDADIIAIKNEILR